MFDEPFGLEVDGIEYQIVPTKSTRDLKIISVDYSVIIENKVYETRVSYSTLLAEDLKPHGLSVGEELDKILKQELVSEIKRIRKLTK